MSSLYLVMSVKFKDLEIKKKSVMKVNMLSQNIRIYEV